MTAEPKVLIPCPETDWQCHIALPKPENNIFGRVIRDPRSNSSNPKERECTEMLCALLKNSSIIQLQILKYFGGLLGQDELDWGDLRFEFYTEQSIGSKRDDLRIIGWRKTEEGSEPLVLWTIEVKVGSSFHESTSILGEDEELADNDQIVNQVINYDRWLARETAHYRGGIVLALSDCSELLPIGLQLKWECASWTRLGDCIGEALGKKGVTEPERFLAKHVLGFIRNNLWRSSEVENSRIGFDDIALLRAFSAYGLELEKKVDGLVSSLFEVVGEFGFDAKRVTHQQSLFKPMGRSILYTNYIDKAVSDYPQLMIGVEDGSAWLWLETAPTNSFKKTITGSVLEALPELRNRNSEWTDGEEGWLDIGIEMPLHTLLAAGTQVSAFQDFYRRGLQDLVAVNLPENIASAIRAGS